MCKCFQYCLESCYWHLIEKRFCYDESIALYEEPGKEEKNNNFFDNLAFYDSVSVIAGRAIVTIDSLPEDKPIVQQPTRKMIRFYNEEDELLKLEDNLIIIPPIKTPLTVPVIFETVEEHDETEQRLDEIKQEQLNVQTDGTKVNSLLTLSPENLQPPSDPQQRKSLRERRMSKSLHLKIEQPKELPLVRQQSMPKFYLDTPSLEEQAAMFRSPGASLVSPLPKKAGFQFDLYSVVQIENEKFQNNVNTKVNRKDSERSSRLLQMKERIMLKRSKSSVGPVTNLPHSHHHI